MNQTEMIKKIKEIFSDIGKENADMSKLNDQNLYTNLREFLSYDRNFHFFVFLVLIILVFLGWMAFENQRRTREGFDLIKKDRRRLRKVRSRWRWLWPWPDVEVVVKPAHVPPSKGNVGAKADIPPASTPEHTANGSTDSPPDGPIPSAPSDAAEQNHGN